MRNHKNYVLDSTDDVCAQLSEFMAELTKEYIYSITLYRIDIKFIGSAFIITGILCRKVGAFVDHGVKTDLSQFYTDR